MASSRKEKEKNSEKGELHCGVTANDNETVYVWGGGGEGGREANCVENKTPHGRYW